MMNMKSESMGDIRHQAQQTDLQHPQWLPLLAALAIVGQVVLLASAWLLPFVSEYSLVGDNISELVLGRYGFVQTIAFLLAGAGTLALAFAIRKVTIGAWQSLTGSLLVGVFGAGAILSAIFPTDRVDSQADVWSQSTTGLIHSFVFLVSILCMLVAMYVLTRTFMEKPRWRSLARWLMFFPAGTLALFVVQGQGPLVGILQRALITIVAAWQILVALKIRSLNS
jgi:hypothetical protein